MDALEFKAAYEWFLLRACFAALAALILAVVCFKVYEHIGRLKAAAKRYGWPLVTLFIICSAWATYTAFPTQEEKNGRPESVVSSQVSVVSGQESELTPNPYLLSLTQEDFARGFVLTRIGTNEVHDFNAPDGAIINSDWLAFGAAEDWIYLEGEGVSSQGLGRERLRVHSDGWVEALSPTSTVFAAREYYPFKTTLGIVPKAVLTPNPYLLTPNSCFWHCFTPSNSLQLTWQNVLYNREVDLPISFQVEFLENGDFIYYYDLSSIKSKIDSGIIPENFPSNITIGTILHYLLPVPQSPFSTSLSFRHLDSSDTPGSDRDGDGLLIEDEIFVYHTDPYNADSDCDGLSDYDEIFIVKSNPLDAYSISNDYYDGFALQLQGENPFACPQGSTNTVLEHIFYSGTTNGVFSLPTSDNETAILKISVSGSGVGRLVVGEKIVPLVGSSTGLTRFTGSGNNEVSITNTLLLAVGRGVRKEVWFTKPDGLDVALRSDDLLIGSLPTFYWPHGWLAFPHKEATVPCIHDFNSRGRVVSLVHGEEFPGLTATWSSEAQGVAITNVPPVSAEIHGSFPKSQERSISYTITHPDYICGVTNYEQTLRFCPKHVDEPANGSGGGSDDEEPEYWSCDCAWSGNCNCCSGEWCHCSCWNCPCNANQSPTLGDDDSDAEEAYTNIVNGTQSALADVFCLYRANTKAKHLAVPGGTPVECCPCPDHRHTNYVAKVAYTSRVAVDYSDGSGEFKVSHVPCDVTLSGVSPSRDFGDSTVVFVTNGVEHSRHDCTVLGVRFESDYSRPPLSEYNQRSSSFGYPITVCTNIGGAATIVLRTDVLLTNGVVRLSMLNATGGFQVWLPEWWDNNADYHAPELLLSSVDRTERYFSIRQWRGIMQRYGWYNGPRTLAVKVLSSSQGHCDLRVDYASSSGAGYVHDHAQQRVTSVNPVLLVDYDRDGAVGATDIARHMAGRYAYFWRNDDKWKGDNAFDLPFFNDINSSDNVVNGRNDLINFLPISVDVSPFASHWSFGSVYYRLETYSSALRHAKLAFADIVRSQIGDAPLGEDSDMDGNALYEAPVFALGDGTNLPPAFVSLAQSGRSTVLMEFPYYARGHDLYLNVYSKSDNALLFSSSIRLHVGDVSQMVGWENLRSVAGGSGGLPTRIATADWPAEEHEPGNVVFVHGYNMEEDVETQLWAQNVFKKLWWSGLDRGFIAVQWRGNEGQVAGTLTPNYYGNVQNAFQTAPALSNAMATVQGPKWFVAHSLGNMLVSAATQDYGMQYEKYFMLNAAIAIEAFDPVDGITTESHDNMTPRSWTNYVDKVRATHWFERFPEGDGRRLLTWKNRFPNVLDIVNFHSTEEEVVNNGDGNLHSIAVRNYVWYNQETRKGLWPMMLHEYEGGWEFNSFYDTVTGSWLGNQYIEQRYHMSPANAAELTDPQLRQKPFFLDFANPEIYSSPNGVIVASNYLYRAEMLAYAIPSESFAVGANPLPGLDDVEDLSIIREGNYDMATLFHSAANEVGLSGDEKKWVHSTFVQRSYRRTKDLYRSIMTLIKQGDNQ